MNLHDCFNGVDFHDADQAIELAQRLRDDILTLLELGDFGDPDAWPPEVKRISLEHPA